MNNPCPDIQFRALCDSDLYSLVKKMNELFDEGWQLVPNTFYPHSCVVVLFRAKK